jgi:hypothetical protein
MNKFHITNYKPLEIQPDFDVGFPGTLFTTGYFLEKQDNWLVPVSVG